MTSGAQVATAGEKEDARLAQTFLLALRPAVSEASSPSSPGSPSSDS